ncbi:MAG TPA: alpha/beta hydrolase [Phycisphaerales bacterium]|nr:alpha/beta hydrolase [Phycisphaerales bacterium]
MLARTLSSLLLAYGMCAQPAHDAPAPKRPQVVTTADEPPTRPLGASLEGFEYPFPVKTHSVTVQGQPLAMAYMDVVPKEEKATGRTVMLLHGKNFFGAYWEQTARDLAAQGHRVVIPDQIGFGKSAKPDDIQYSFHMLAENTASLLDALGVARADVVGHSMGGMLATRFALVFPERTASLTLVNPIGLEDYRVLAPYQSVARWYEREVKQTFESLAKYQRENYYGGTWNEGYARWVRPIAAMTLGPDYPKVARVNALTYDMIYTQPVCYEFGRIGVPTLLIIGQRDRTAIGKDLATPQGAAKMGDYPALGARAAKAIPSARLVALDGVGHVPQIEAYERFISALESFISALPAPAPPIKPLPPEKTPAEAPPPER